MYFVDLKKAFDCVTWEALAGNERHGLPLHIVNLLHGKQQANQCTTTRGLPRLCDLAIPIQIMAEMVTREALNSTTIRWWNSNMRKKNYKCVLFCWQAVWVHSESELQEMANHVGQAGSKQSLLINVLFYLLAYSFSGLYIPKSLVNNFAKI